MSYNGYSAQEWATKAIDTADTAVSVANARGASLNRYGSCSENVLASVSYLAEKADNAEANYFRVKDQLAEESGEHAALKRRWADALVAIEGMAHIVKHTLEQPELEGVVGNDVLVFPFGGKSTHVAIAETHAKLLGALCGAVAGYKERVETLETILTTLGIDVDSIVTQDVIGLSSGEVEALDRAMAQAGYTAGVNDDGSGYRAL